MPIILICGVDKAGKSTFARKLCAALGGEYQHYSKPDIDPYEYFSPALSLAESGKLIVCDRHCVGEKVYAEVKHEESKWKPGDYEKMLEKLESMHASIFHVWESQENLHRRLKELGDNYVKENEMMLIQELFAKEISRIAKVYPGITCLSFRPTYNFINILK